MSVNILIVEGDPRNRRFLADALQANGYSTATAKGREEASSALSNESFGLALIEPFPTAIHRQADQDLGAFLDELSGVHDVPVIAITSSAGAGDDRKFADYISKPVRLETLLKLVESKIGPGRNSKERRRTEDE